MQLFFLSNDDHLLFLFNIVKLFDSFARKWLRAIASWKLLHAAKGFDINYRQPG